MPTDTESGDPGADIRGDIGAALDSLSSTETTTTESTPPPPREENAPDDQATDTRTAAERARDEQGRFAKGEKPPPQAKPPPDAKQNPPPIADANATKPPPTALPKSKAPAGWKPEARSHWDKIPPAVQAEVSRRERDTAVALQRAAEVEKAHGQFRQAVQPFEQAIRARGGEVLPTVANLLQTAEALYSAPAPMKASILARMVTGFGVPVEELAQALTREASGQPPPQQTQQQQFRDPRLDQYIQAQEQEKQQRQQQIHAHYDNQVEEWSGDKPYFDDVRDEMADLMEAAGKRGHQLSFDQAYKMAIQFHPDIQALESQREESERVRSGSADVERLRVAGSSVRNEPVGTQNGGPQPGEDMRSDVMAALRRVEGRK